MKTIRIISMIFSLFLICYSCTDERHNSTGPEIIDVTGAGMISELDFKIVNIIQLESNDRSIIGHASPVKYYKDRIFLFDKTTNKSLFAFDTTGKFINRTMMGRGPSELLFPVAFTIDEKNDMILIYDQGSFRLMMYDFNLNYIKHINANEIFMSDLAMINDSIFLVRHRSLKSKNIEGAEFYAYTLYNTDFKSGRHSDIVLTSNTTPSAMGNPITKRDGSLLFISEYDYTIYRLREESITEAYRIDFGEKGYSDEELHLLSTAEMFEQRSAGRKIVHFHSLISSKSFLVVTYLTDIFRSVFYSPETDKVYDFDSNIKNRLFPECKIWGSIRDDLFYATTTPSDLNEFIENTNQYSSIKITDNDNPYLITFKVMKSN